MEYDLEQLMKGRETFAQQGGRDVCTMAGQFELVNLLRAMGYYPYYFELSRNDGPTAQAGDRQFLMFGSNNYLALTQHPEVTAAAARACMELGTSMTGSRLLNGTASYHVALEREIAQFVGKEAALVTSTGYQANVGLLSALLNRNCVAVLDRYCHASMVDGCRVANCEIRYFKHNDTRDLEKVLAEIPPQKGVLVMVDGVYSMEGDIAPVPDIVRVAHAVNARVMVDDAHGLGVLGQGGRGTASHFGLTDEVDLIVGTFSKSLASIGGWIAGKADVIDYVKHFGRPLLFSASASPSAVAAAGAALNVLRTHPEMVDHLAANARYWQDGLRALGLEVGASASPIVPILIGSEIPTLGIWKELLDAGVFVNPVVYPAVPHHRAMLRTSVTAGHTREHLDQALEIVGRVTEAFNIRTTSGVTVH